MPERRLEKTREAYDEQPKWRPSHENTAERLKQAAQRITQRYLTGRDPGDENDTMK